MQRKPKSYSAALMDQIPIKYLVTQAQGLQQELGGETWTSTLPEKILICLFGEKRRQTQTKRKLKKHIVYQIVYS